MLDYSGKRFLIVDDFSDFRSSVKAMLREMGVRDVDTADRGEQAIAMCRHKRYDIILHDYNLGAGKNGLQTLEELHAARLISHQCIFVMVTAESSQAMVLSLLEHEPDAYLTKPFNRAGLTQRLDKLVERKTLLKPVLQALDKRNPAEVLSACETLASQDKRLQPLCLKYKAGALRELGRQQELERLLQAVLADRAMPWAYQALGNLLNERGDLARAKDTFEQGLKAFPMQPGLYDGLAGVLEKQGDAKQAQQVLEEAVRLSPLALPRQMQLGKLAMHNEDFAGATKAYRSAVEQGKNSRLKSPENYLALSQALMADTGEETLSKRAQMEISQVLGELGSQYAADKTVQVRKRLMQARSLQKSNEPARAAQLAAEAAAELQQVEAFLPAEVALGMVEQFQQLGQQEAGAKLLKDCLEIHGDDAGVLEAAARLTDDQSVFVISKEATDLNRQGVQAYKQGRTDEALALFRRALGLQPKNISIALNTAQSLLRLGLEQPSQPWLEEARSCLDGVSMIAPSDTRYARYQQLRSRVFDT
ncbi:response regulator [Pseudomonas sp. GOM7]|uniref:tetratricopeptide repeat-containing response regulator n=1 Tax=unclassified Pseudomonas TaxID=196821 RepID=UPI00227C54AE|nr:MULTISPECIES: tetratricopeptide repeat-containing response regulator [unclassified Pseudomonas]WAJ37558.1 response regulator [Pseudomonas sp. GOM7]